jgi:polyferredoxin
MQPKMHWIKAGGALGCGRVLVYFVILMFITGGLMASLYARAPFKVDVVRDRGSLGRVVEDGVIENVYRIQIMNATESEQRFHVMVDQLPHVQVRTPDDIVVGPAEARWVPVSVQIPPEVAGNLGTGPHRVEMVVTREQGVGGAETSVREKTTFMVPR